MIKCLVQPSRNSCDIMRFFYEKIIENLSHLQVNLIKAVAEDETMLSSTEVIRKYDLVTSGNIETLKKALANKEIINFSGSKPEFEDPLFKYWFKRLFYKYSIILM